MKVSIPGLGKGIFGVQTRFVHLPSMSERAYGSM